MHVSIVIFGLVKLEEKNLWTSQLEKKGKRTNYAHPFNFYPQLFLESFYNNLIKKKDFFDLPTWNSYHHFVLMRVCFYYGICQFLWIIYSHKFDVYWSLMRQLCCAISRNITLLSVLLLLSLLIYNNIFTMIC